MGNGNSMPCTSSATNDKPTVVTIKQLPANPNTPVKDATALLGMGGGGTMNLQSSDDTFYEEGERETFTSARNPRAVQELE